MAMSTLTTRPVDMMETPPAAPLGQAKGWARKGFWWYLAGCIVCGTWVLGPPGAIMILYGLWLIRKGDKAGFLERPWTILLIGGFILTDTSVNMTAWGFDLFPAHGSDIGRSLWINYGLAVDGAYIFDYNAGGIGGVSDHGEKAIQIAMVTMAMPIKLAACWGFLNLKRWGLQWMIISYWMYFLIWMIYMPNMLLDFDLRYGASDFGVFGFWLLVNIPFLGPLVLLPYLHTINTRRWTD